jgi:hypothetical protein
MQLTIATVYLKVILQINTAHQDFDLLKRLQKTRELVEMTGIEPATFCLQSRRSTN